MSMDLKGGSGGARIDVTCRITGWIEILKLAEFAGWEPAGTGRPHWSYRVLTPKAEHLMAERLGVWGRETGNSKSIQVAYEAAKNERSLDGSWNAEDRSADEAVNDALEEVNASYGWDGRYPQGYLSNDGQFVTAADATALADALERSLPDIPLRSLIKPQRLIFSGEGLREALERAVRAPYRPENWPQGLADVLQRLAGPDGRALVSEIIRLCRAGGFYIQ